MKVFRGYLTCPNMWGRGGQASEHKLGREGGGSVAGEVVEEDLVVDELVVDELVVDLEEEELTAEA